MTNFSIRSLFFSFLLFPFFVWGQAPEEKTTPQEYIDRYKVIAIKKRIEYRIPASITLAQGILESGNGNSRLAVHANNHFGIKCHLEWAGNTFHKDDDAKDECFRKYDNPEASFDDHSEFLTSRSRYSFLFDYKVTEYKKWAKGLKKAGYATNPRYPILLTNIIKRYKLHQYDTMSIAYAQSVPKKGPRSPDALRKVEAKSKKDEQFDEVKEPGESYVGTQERIIKRNNRIKYIIARKGDDRESIAEETGMWVWQIERYNELNKSRKIEAGQIVYLQPKRRRGSERHHIVKKGETMYEISQKYGIKLKHIYRRNRMEEGTTPKPGQKLWLRGRKPRH